MTSKLEDSLTPGQVQEEPADCLGGVRHKGGVNLFQALGRKCVQRRLVCSARVSLAGVIARDPVAWMAGRRETEYLKPIDKAIQGMVSESPGRNESERRGGPERE